MIKIIISCSSYTCYLIRSYKRHQGSSFMFGSRHVLAQSWFIDKPKIGLKVQPNKPLTSLRMLDIVERRIGKGAKLVELKTHIQDDSVDCHWLIVLSNSPAPRRQPWTPQCQAVDFCFLFSSFSTTQGSGFKFLAFK